MPDTEGIAEKLPVKAQRRRKEVSLWGAAVIIGVIFLSAVGASILIGYEFFWNKSTAPTRIQVMLERAKYAVKQNPNDANAWVDLGYAHYEAGELAQARRSYQKALQLAPGNVWINYFLGLVEFQAGDYRQAETAFRKVTQVYRDNPLGRYMLARAYHQQGKDDQALAELNTIVERIDRSIADVYELRGQIYEKKGRKAPAIEEYRQALRLDPARTEPREGLRRLGVPERDIPPPGSGPHRR